MCELSLGLRCRTGRGGTGDTSWFSSLMVLLVVGPGCVTTRAFVPGEHVTGLSPRGSHYASEYTVRDADHLIAEVKVWSLGATRDTSEGVTTIEVGFEVENLGEMPVRLEPKQLFLDDVAVDDDDPELDRVRPVRVHGDSLVPPGEERVIEVSFSLPDDVWPTDVVGYRVVWKLSNGGSYSQKTPFLRAARLRDDPYDPFYGPYYGFSYWTYPYGTWPSWRYRPYYPAGPYRRIR